MLLFDHFNLEGIPYAHWIQRVEWVSGLLWKQDDRHKQMIKSFSVLNFMHIELLATNKWSVYFTNFDLLPHALAFLWKKLMLFSVSFCCSFVSCSAWCVVQYLVLSVNYAHFPWNWINVFAHPRLQSMLECDAFPVFVNIFLGMRCFFVKYDRI